MSDSPTMNENDSTDADAGVQSTNDVTVPGAKECPECGAQALTPSSGCSYCSECGFSPCH